MENNDNLTKWKKKKVKNILKHHQKNGWLPVDDALFFEQYATITQKKKMQDNANQKFKDFIKK